MGNVLYFIIPTHLLTNKVTLGKISFLDLKSVQSYGEKTFEGKGARLLESDGFICKILVFVLLRPHISHSFTHKFSTVSECMHNFASCHPNFHTDRRLKAAW